MRLIIILLLCSGVLRAESPATVYQVRILPNMVGYWPCNDTGNDYYGTNNLTEVGMAATNTVTGKFGYAYDYDGTNNWLTKEASVTGIGGVIQMTVTAWVKQRGTTGNAMQGIFSVGDTAGYKYIRLGSTREVTYDNNIRMDWGDDDENDYKVVYTNDNAWTATNGVIPLGVWTFLASTYDGDDTPIRCELFKNGVRVTTTKRYGTGDGLVEAPVIRLNIGNYGSASNTSNTQFDGVIDDVIVWHTYLSTNAIQGLYYQQGIKHGIN